MIEITRSLARHLRAVFRRALWAGTNSKTRPPVVFAAGPAGLVIHSQHGGTAVVYRQPGSFSPETIALAGDFLQDIEGTKDTPVQLEAVGLDTYLARWDEAGVPRVQQYAAIDPQTLPALPDRPTEFLAPGPNFFQALDQAGQTAAGESVRFALSKVQLRQSGEIVATDGKQLLLHKGFRFSWASDLLVPKTTAFGLAELQRQEQVEVGQTETHVCLQAGPWEIFLPIDKEGRFPRADDVVPKISQGSTCCRFSSQDAAFLLRSLPGLPTDEDNDPVTLDLNGAVVVRARTPGQERGTELILAGSESTGKSVRLCMNRRYLTRALELGFSQFDIVSPDVPVQCRDESRTYLWMPLSKEGALAPSDKDLRVNSSSVVNSDPPVNNTNETPKKRIKAMTQTARLSAPPPSPSPNGDKDHLEGNGGSLIEQVQALQGTLREALNQTTRLVQGLRHQRKQSRLMKATLANLRQLQQVAE